MFYTSKERTGKDRVEGWKVEEEVEGEEVEDFGWNRSNSQ